MPNTLSILSIALTAALAFGEYVAPSDIKKGCARFYMSNPFTYVKGFSEQGTQYWQVCVAPMKDKPAKVAIGAGLFAKIKDKFGADTANSISFISTGPDCWVDIFSGKQQTGETYGITPLSDVDLATLPLYHIEGHTSFNDNIMSGYIRSTDSAGENPDSGDIPEGTVPIACWYTFESVTTVPKDNGCSYFYDRDPNVELANGFAICMSDNQHLAHVNQHDMDVRNYKDVLKSGKIAAVHVGDQLEVGVYAKDEFEGHKTIVDLNEDHYIHQEVQSFIMISTKYAKQITPEAMFTAAEKFLHGEGPESDI